MLLIENFIALFLESAPWLILGLTVAGIMESTGAQPTNRLSIWVNRGPMATVKAALVWRTIAHRAPVVVIPAALGLRRSGASKAATTSFLISTPETGVDSVSISYAMLGPFMAIIRPIAAITSAITAGILDRHREQTFRPVPATSQQKRAAPAKPRNQSPAVATKKHR